MAATVAHLWQEAVQSRRTNAAYLVEDAEAWRQVGWAEAGRSVDELAQGLLALGVRRDVVGLWGSTSLEWCLVDFALASIGAISVPVYPASSSRDAASVLTHSESRAAIVEGEREQRLLRERSTELPRLEEVLTFADLDDLRERGRAHAAKHPGALAAATAAVSAADVYTYVYTSGTTGEPKGCVLTHGSYAAMTAAVLAIEGLTVPEDVMLLTLPLAHTFGRLLHLLGPAAGFTTALLPDPARLPEALPAVRPTLLPGVPRMYEKLHAAVLDQLEGTTGARRRLARWAVAVGRRATSARQDGSPLPPRLSLQHRLADRLVFRKVKRRLGGRLRLAVSGGAPLAVEVAELLFALDVPVLEGYGLTECTSGCTFNRPGRFRLGTVGVALPGFEVRTIDGEIAVRSETVFAGYLKDPEGTRAVLTHDGWLLTGDVGEIDRDGFVTVTDRKKDLIVTAGGKNVAPQSLENGLRSSRYVSQALVVGDRRPYLVALLTLDEAEVAAWGGGRSLSGSVEQLAGDPRISELLQSAVDDVNAERSSFEQIKRFAVLPRDFSAAEDEVTPTLKLRRRACERHFAAEIDRLYGS